MHQPSFLRTWRKRVNGRPQTAPEGALPEMHSNNATSAPSSLLTVSKGNKSASTPNFVTVEDKYTSRRSPTTAPLPHSPSLSERPLPPMPPQRPPRPPPLDLDGLDSSSSHSPISSRRRRRPPQLENTWASFLVEDDHLAPRANFTRYSNASNPTLSASKSPSHASDYSDSDGSADGTHSITSSDFPLSLFPKPPPLRTHRPPPLTLRPTPTIAPLPPSPAFINSNDSTPVATPTTPVPRQRQLTSPIIMLKKPSGRRALPISPPSSPPTSPLPPSPNVVKSPIGPRLRSAQSVPHLQPIASTHRNTSSDSITQRQPRPPLPLDREVRQWGYAI
ncbi:hypothetical protein MIND_00701500 [Mycena indigotica]|uniref:Uncharacterized protein n=1 Tax=Mycena indigotica TaxID=2126181 RepID=A0A8H6SKM6_9AGAR|nr:uncharacterized protein MIND_00701500 [Mycena indigotica]KAF7301363.1 hypothetical protein MIND_00701500 [Mycena indigotica]